MFFQSNLLSKLKQLIQQHTFVSIVIGVLFVALGTGAVVVASKPAPQSNDQTSKKSGTSAKLLGANTSDPQSNASQAPTNATKNATTNTKPATSTKPAPVTAKDQRLTISPASITIAAGQAFKGITIKTNDGKKVNMPMLGGGAHRNSLLVNFPAGPAKTSWTGDILSQKTIPAGTYTYEITAQADRTTFYKGSLTITVLPSPFMTITVQSHGYDAEDDALLYSVEVVRHNGYSQPIERVAGVSFGNQGLECYAEPIDEDIYALVCGHSGSGARPTSGTISINAFSGSDVASTSTAFTLPPL